MSVTDFQTLPACEEGSSMFAPAARGMVAISVAGAIVYVCSIGYVTEEIGIRCQRELSL